MLKNEASLVRCFCKIQQYFSVLLDFDKISSTSLHLIVQIALDTHCCSCFLPSSVYQGGLELKMLNSIRAVAADFEPNPCVIWHTYSFG